ncbi:outer membrane autotransporter barrel domain protein, partial [Escherichia coli 88.1467]
CNAELQHASGERYGS